MPERPGGIDPVEALARSDKWYLGCGDGILFAPPFPVWLSAPGFWDDATFYQYQVGPLFTVTWLTAGGAEIPLKEQSRRWTPADLTVEYELGSFGRATEVRSVQPGGIFASEWELRLHAPLELHAIAWTLQDSKTLNLTETCWDRGLALVRRVSDRRDVTCDLRLELAVVGDASSYCAVLSERSAAQPHWRFTPFGELWQGDRLPSTVRLEGVNPDGFVYAGVHLSVAAGAERPNAAFAMRVTASDESLAGATRPTPLGLSAIRAERALTPVSTQAVAGGSISHAQPLARASRRRWREHFGAVPEFTCSDPYLERYYKYRWYGIFLNAIQGGRGNYPWPTVCEGIGFFHQPITYSAQCHVRELRWLRDPTLARGVLRTMFEHQKPNGALHGRVYVNHLQGTDFYHANWAGAFTALDAVHPDTAFRSELFPKFAHYAEWLLSTRDREGDGMIDVVDQYETGQEYMSRYQAVDPKADAYGWENRIRLKGIDVTVYAFELFQWLAVNAEPRAAQRWQQVVERTRRAVLGQMWDGGHGMFSDVDPRTGRRTGVRAAVCFYPYFADLATQEHVEGLERNLLDPAQFWTAYPVPSSSCQDPLFSPIAEWKGKRHVCPWNGRVWPMTNSHLVEALGRWATPDRPTLRAATGKLLQRFVRMMFHNGDLDRPNCFEHYNPFTGSACEYRGIDDYQHSWVVDLIIQYACGVRPTATALVVDPMPMDLESFELRGVRIRGHDVTVRLDHGHLTVTMDDALYLGKLGDPVIIPW